MCGVLEGAAVAFGAINAYKGAQTRRQAMYYEGQIAENNAQIAQWQASDAIRRGNEAGSSQKLRTGRAAARQRLALAANGVALDSGSAERLMADTEFLGEMDAVMIADNAQREAYGFRTQQEQYQRQAAANRAGARSVSPFLSGAASVVGSASQFAGAYDRNKRRAEYSRRQSRYSSGEHGYFSGGL